MARQNKSDNFLATIFLFLLGIIIMLTYNMIVKYFEEVKKRNLWNESILTIVFYVLANLIPISLSNSGVVDSFAITMSLGLSFVVFCIYWWYRFSS